MNRKQQIKWRFRRFRLRSAVFMRRNGLYLALAGCLASLGGAAVLIFTAGGNDAPNAPVNRSDDQRLENVLNTVSAESGTPVPAVETPAAGISLAAPSAACTAGIHAHARTFARTRTDCGRSFVRIEAAG